MLVVRRACQHGAQLLPSFRTAALRGLERWRTNGARKITRGAMTEGAKDYILIIEDDAGVRNGIANVIENEGYAVESCADARAALDRLSAAADLPRMILLDFVMPEMDGWAFLRERQKDVRLRSIPVLGMSASQLLRDR